MRLLHVQSLQLQTFHDGDTPPYAIASHRWIQNGEATLDDIKKKRNLRKAGFRKVRSFAVCVKRRFPNIEWLWIDTCCIDQNSSAEVTEAINSMFRWYRNATICLAYLRDITSSSQSAIFGQSEWFHRGWTLQELLAPRVVVFFTQDWSIIGHKGEQDFAMRWEQENVGRSRNKDIAMITSIPEEILCDYKQSSLVATSDKLQWIHGRSTTRGEDIAYCMFGIVDVAIGANYGEGELKAKRRLLAAIDAEATAKTQTQSTSQAFNHQVSGTVHNVFHNTHNTKVALQIGGCQHINGSQTFTF